MNPIEKALDEIRFTIPREILQEAFIPRELNLPQGLISLETRIREAVLEPRVLVDMDIQGGTDAYLPLDRGERANPYDPFTIIYRIPDELTQGRPIVEVYSIHFGILGYQQAGMLTTGNTSAIGSAMRRVVDAAAQVPPAMTSYLNMIAHNTIMVRYPGAPSIQAFTRVRLGNDDALSHVRPQAYHTFAELCVLAVKAYVFNQLRIKIDQGFLSGGQMLGSFLDTVMNYSDSEQMYREAVTGWKRASVYNDPEARRRHLRSLVGAP